MNKKIILLVFIGILVVTLGGLAIWRIFYQQKSSEINITSQPSPTNYPKAESYQVPILMYHYIRDAEGESELGKNLSVSPTNFDAQIKWFRENNYQTLTIADLADPEQKVLAKIIYQKQKPIILTFDDGYTDAYTQALPILKKYQMTATFYIIKNYIGKPEYMDQKQIDELAANGMEIGSHTLSHPDLTKIDISDAQKQITESKVEATTFCYPSGKYNADTVKLVQTAGYRAVVTTKFGIADQNSSLFELPRVRVENTSPEVLVNKIEAALQ